jgi:hypothetical protein
VPAADNKKFYRKPVAEKALARAGALDSRLRGNDAARGAERAGSERKNSGYRKICLFYFLFHKNFNVFLHQFFYYIIPAFIGIS